jgi:hypothetical protein
MNPPCCPQFGFATSSFESMVDTGNGRRVSTGVGDDEFSWGVDGERGKRWHAGGEAYSGRKWKEGDVLGFACSLDDGTLHVSINGDYGASDGAVFTDIMHGKGSDKWLFPAFSAKHMTIRCNFGSKKFKYGPPHRQIFPGEVGDSFSESLVMVTVQVEALDEASAKICQDAAIVAMQEAVAHVLETEEEKARGVTTLDHNSCLNWIAKNSMLFRGVPHHDPGLVAGTVLVGVLLPVIKKSAQVKCEILQKNILAGIPKPCKVTASVQSSKTLVFCSHPNIEELRKSLEELSFEELKKNAQMDEYAASAGCTSTREILSSALVASFVRSELQEDWKIALESAQDSLSESMLDFQVKALLKAWGIATALVEGVSPAERINLAIKALNSEERWQQVEEWVGLYRGRIQGRTRLGLKGLMKREQDKIQRYMLVQGEVLALYLYTGPEFVPMNGICRSFPQSILNVLKGDATTPDNKLCTTLFCISSGLKKIARSTKLPENRKVFRGLGRMLLPMQFWVPHGTPAWRGGVERAFMSTTADKNVALFYANGRGTVVEISVGRIQIGGDVSFLSMVSSKKNIS